MRGKRTDEQTKRDAVASFEEFRVRRRAAKIRIEVEDGRK